LNIELNELGMTFLVGALVILGVDAIRFAVWGTHLTRLSEEVVSNVAADKGTAVITTGIFVGLSFAIGLLVEDACYKFHDPFLYWPLEAAHHVVGSALPSSGDLKFDLQRGVLFEELSIHERRLTPLGEQVCNAKLIELSFASNGKPVADWMCRGGARPSRVDRRDPFYVVDRTIRSAFYFAKNRVYMITEYSSEMKRIQSRLEFSRTVATLTFGGAVITLPLALLSIIFIDRDDLLRRIRNSALLTLAFVAVYILAYVAYMQESEEYNKRIFGYYASMSFAAATHVP